MLIVSVILLIKILMSPLHSARARRMPPLSYAIHINNEPLTCNSGILDWKAQCQAIMANSDSDEENRERESERASEWEYYRGERKKKNTIANSFDSNYPTGSSLVLACAKLGVILILNDNNNWACVEKETKEWKGFHNLWLLTRLGKKSCTK